ncbi:MAG: hypothetical protein QGH94_19760, partial [Phycisphaerae bacterium]|nr:hypothetical protein [Phycisphaerae bacterium]
AQSMDALVVVVNPDRWSVQTAVRVRDLAADLGMKKVFAVANRLGLTGPDAASDPQVQLDNIQAALGDVPLIGSLPFDPALGQGALKITPDGKFEPTEALIAHRTAVEGVIAELQRRV